MSLHSTSYVIYALGSLRVSRPYISIDYSTLNKISQNFNAQFVDHGTLLSCYCKHHKCINLYKFRLKHALSLRKHISRHKEVEIKCDICGKVTPNKTSLGRHIKYVHSEATHKCGICDKAFKRDIGLKVYLSNLLM